MSRLVVAGGAGFIGANLCRAVLERGDTVVCVDNLVTGSQANVRDLQKDPRFSFVPLDVCEGVEVEGAVDAVLNLASPASPVDFGPLALAILDVGSRGTASLLALAEAKDARFLQASTSEVYGDPLVHPQPESYWGNVNPNGLRSVYDEAKRFGEALVCAHQRAKGTDVRIVRIFNTYGPRMRADDGRVVSSFVTQALRGEPLLVHGDGKQTRSFCFVDDLVAGILAALGSDHQGPINLGTDDERPVVELAELVVALTGSASTIEFAVRPPDDPAQRRPDLRLARELLGWQPTTSLDEGLRRTIEWFAGANRPGSAPARRP